MLIMYDIGFAALRSYELKWRRGRNFDTANRMSFLNFLLAEALAAGLTRAEAEEKQQAPPSNFFVLPRDPQAWCKFHEACRKENMVIAVEITDNSKANCKRVQPLFVKEARNFESIPFVRVEIEFGLTYEQVLL